MPPSTLEPPETRPRGDEGLPEDHSRRRLGWAIAASVVINGLLWQQAARIFPHQTQPPAVIEITRVALPRIEKVHPKPKPRIIPPKPKPIVRTPPPPKAHVAPPPRVTPPKPSPEPPRHEAPRPAPPRPAAHSHVLTARPDHTAPAPSDHTALAGGHANLGTPLHTQSDGGARTEPPAPPTRPAPPQPAPTPAPESPKPTPQPEPPPKPAPPQPAPSGPTQDAEPQNQEKPEIPEELKQDTFKSFVRVRVEIEPDGSFTPTLRTSSGNAEIDRRVLNALKRWRWKPALQNGVPVHSTQLFKFEFEVE